MAPMLNQTYVLREIEKNRIPARMLILEDRLLREEEKAFPWRFTLVYSILILLVLIKCLAT